MNAEQNFEARSVIKGNARLLFILLFSDHISHLSHTMIKARTIFMSFWLYYMSINNYERCFARCSRSSGIRVSENPYSARC
jgi:hypothetical protein